MRSSASFKAAAQDADTPEALRDLFSARIKELGYHAFDAYTLRTGTISNADQIGNLFICDYGLTLPGIYVREGWLQMDPVIARIARTSEPFEYLECLRNTQQNASVKWQLGVLRMVNVRRAWVIPLSIVEETRGMTVYMRGNRKGLDEIFLSTRDDIHLMCVDFMTRFVMLKTPGEASDSDWYEANELLEEITRRQADCLHWAARGKTNAEIAAILSISENTVRFHMKKAYAKLGVNSRSSAVSAALRRKIIEL